MIYIWGKEIFEKRSPKWGVANKNSQGSKNGYPFPVRTEITEWTITLKKGSRIG